MGLGGLAAGIALFTAAQLFNTFQHETVFSTAQGEFRRIPLEDSSVANINSDSVIAVNLTSKVRQVALQKGEAWFEVAKDKSKPFVVEAGDIRVRAVGTAFSVRRHGTGAEVLVTEGKVEVWSQAGDARRYELVAGDRGFVPSSAAQVTISHQPAEIARKLAWREGKLIFESQTLNEAVADFNRYSLKKIVVVDPDLGSKTLIGQYQIDAPERFARNVSALLDVPFYVTPERIVIGGHVSGGKNR
jgi:transmembrane sensor